MSIKLVKVKDLKGGEKIRTWYGYKFIIAAFSFGPGGQVTLLTRKMMRWVNGILNNMSRC